MALIKCPDCETDVSDQAVACPKCARPIKPTPKARKSSPKVEEDADDVGDKASDEGGASPTTLFPRFCKRPIPCPGCGKKALRPRMRTRDFRCQACSVIYPGREIEDAVAEIEDAVAELEATERLWARWQSDRQIARIKDAEEMRAQAQVATTAKTGSQRSDTGLGRAALGLIFLVVVGALGWFVYAGLK